MLQSTFVGFLFSFIQLCTLGLAWFMVFNATFNNFSVISWWWVLLVEETGVPRENHWAVASHWQSLSHNVASSTPHHNQGFKLTTLVVIGTDCTGSCKFKYYTITTTQQSLPVYFKLWWCPTGKFRTSLTSSRLIIIVG